MSEIIDILTAPAKDCLYFTANNAVDYVIPTTAPAADFTLKTADNKDVFEIGDNFTILSVGYVLPEAYTLWKHRGDLLADDYGIMFALLNLLGVSGAYYNIDSLGRNPRIYMPLECYEMETEIFVDVTKQTNVLPPNNLLTEKFKLSFLPFPFKISQRGQPAAFNGKQFIISPFVKIAHNFPLVIV